MIRAAKSMRFTELILALSLLAVASVRPAAAGPDTYRKMTGAEIRSRVIGMEISEPHFSEQYLRNGAVRIVSLGRRYIGKWKISGVQLCIEAPTPEDLTCREIWRSGEKYQLRFPGDAVPFDVDIQTHQDRGW